MNVLASIVDIDKKETAIPGDGTRTEGRWREYVIIHPINNVVINKHAQVWIVQLTEVGNEDVPFWLCPNPMVIKGMELIPGHPRFIGCLSPLGIFLQCGEAIMKEDEG